MSDFALPDDTLRSLLTRDKQQLAEQAAAGRGYVLNVQKVYVPPVALLGVPSNEGVSAMARIDTTANEPYIPEEDVTETQPDGRVIQVAAKGVPISYARAVQLGLVKPTKNAGPSEVKTQADLDQLLTEKDAEIVALRQQLADRATEQVNAQAAQAMQENTGDPKAQAPSVAEAEAAQAAAADAQKRQDAANKAKK